MSIVDYLNELKGCSNNKVICVELLYLPVSCVIGASKVLEVQPCVRYVTYAKYNKRIKNL